jgi:AraC-like DNA-binding protein
MVFVRALASAYEKYGVDPAGALASARISPAQLRRLNGRIDADQFEALSAFAMQEIDDEGIGWFSRRLPWGTYGMLCRASLGAPTVGVALRRWCRHHRLLTEDLLLTVTPEAAGDGSSPAGARLSIEVRREPGKLGPLASRAEVRELCLLTLLRYVHGYSCWLMNSRLPLREVTFPFAAPAHEHVYPLLFSGPVRFEASRASFLVDGRYLAIAPRRDERAMDRMLRRALPLTVRPYRHDRFLADRVRQHLSESRTGGPIVATGAALATALHLSVRSLHRGLAAEGTSLQALKDEVRRRRATELLRRTTLPIKQVALAAGFASEKSFARAFRQWTGESPSEHRNKGESI